jgi:hypothetical protein
VTTRQIVAATGHVSPGQRTIHFDSKEQGNFLHGHAVFDSVKIRLRDAWAIVRHQHPRAKPHDRDAQGGKGKPEDTAAGHGDALRCWYHQLPQHKEPPVININIPADKTPKKEEPWMSHESSDGSFRQGEPPIVHGKNKPEPPGLLFKIYFWTIMAVPCAFLLLTCLALPLLILFATFLQFVPVH